MGVSNIRRYIDVAIGSYERTGRVLVCSCTHTTSRIQIEQDYAIDREAVDDYLEGSVAISHNCSVIAIEARNNIRRRVGAL